MIIIVIKIHMLVRAATVSLNPLPGEKMLNPRASNGLRLGWRPVPGPSRPPCVEAARIGRLTLARTRSGSMLNTRIYTWTTTSLTLTETHVRRGACSCDGVGCHECTDISVSLSPTCRSLPASECFRCFLQMLQMLPSACTQGCCMPSHTRIGYRRALEKEYSKKYSVEVCSNSISEIAASFHVCSIPIHTAL